MDDRLRYWLRGGAVQNFGDHLTELLADRLFYRLPPDVAGIHLVGSVIADASMTEERDDRPIVFWGCGVRSADGLSLEHRPRARILAVRGPISAATLRLPDVPQGDSALLLPAVYRPAESPAYAGRTLCVPHFYDRRSDAELLAMSGCDMVLRPNIPAGQEHLQAFIDALVAADFVLTAALHGAIVAAAYDRPFAFWDPGTIDVPLKWSDFAASIKIPMVFQTGLAAARAHHAQAIGPVLTKLPLFPLLAHAPLLLRPDAALAVVRHDARLTGDPDPAAAIERCLALLAAQREHFEALEQSVRTTLHTGPSRTRQLLASMEHGTNRRMTTPLRALGRLLPGLTQDGRRVARETRRLMLPASAERDPVAADTDAADPSDEAGRRRSIARARATDMQRWTDPASYEPDWDRRAAQAAELAEGARWVCDIGCGMQTLRQHLPPGTHYLPADLRRWTPDVAFCDINARHWPVLYLACCDAAFLLGVLEFIADPRPLLAMLRANAGTVVLSYNAVDLAHRDRGALGFVNAWSTEQLSYLLYQARFRVTRTVRFENAQILIRAEGPPQGRRQRLRQSAARAIYQRRPRTAAPLALDARPRTAPET